MNKAIIARTAAALVLGALVIACLYAGGPFILAVVILAAATADYEIWDIGHNAGFQPSLPVGMILALGFVLSAYFEPKLVILLFAIALILSIFWLNKNDRAIGAILADWALTLIGAVYTGGILSLGIHLRNLPNGLAIGAIVLAGTWVCDTMAFIIGKRFGRRKFAPTISPNKTWEGTIGGFLFGLIGVVVVGYLTGIPLIHSVMLGVLIPVAVILGDLTESLFKRSAGVKDSGQLIPGHGGILDRIDGLLFAVLATYVYVQWAFP